MNNFQAELQTRLDNPAVSAAEILTYLEMAKRDVDSGLYGDNAYNSQVLDTACHLLSLDNKFPEISSSQSKRHIDELCGKRSRAMAQTHNRAQAGASHRTRIMMLRGLPSLAARRIRGYNL